MVKTCKICERKLVLNPSVNDNQGFLNFFKNIFSSNNNKNLNNLKNNNDDRQSLVICTTGTGCMQRCDCDYGLMMQDRFEGEEFNRCSRCLKIYYIPKNSKFCLNPK
jgi:hypothetical protein